MRAVVTGGAGFIGSALTRALVAQGNDVTVLDNLSVGQRTNVPEGAHFIVGDIRDRETVLLACANAEVVFHQAALNGVPRSFADPRSAIDSNVTGTLNVLDSAASQGVRRVVYASSAAVYGNPSQEVQSEQDLPDPLSPYAMSKLAGEHLCRVWGREFGLSTVSLRYFNVIGPGQDPGSGYAAVVPAFCTAIAQGRSPEIDGDGEQARDFVAVDDVVQANLAAAAAGPQSNGLVSNVATGVSRSINDLWHEIRNAAKTEIQATYGPARSGDVRYSRAQVEVADRELNWRAARSWESIIAETVRYFLGDSGI